MASYSLLDRFMPTRVVFLKEFEAASDGAFEDKEAVIVRSAREIV